jgi:hypothetical protein
MITARVFECDKPRAASGREQPSVRRMRRQQHGPRKCLLRLRGSSHRIFEVPEKYPVLRGSALASGYQSYGLEALQEGIEFWCADRAPSIHLALIEPAEQLAQC